MNAVLVATPMAPTPNGLLLAVTIAVTVTAVVAIGMLVVALRRRMRLTPLAGGLSGAAAAAVLVGALLVGGSLTQSPAAVAGGDTVSKGVAQQPIEAKLTGLQLPTL
jgi:hypothetical protein